jgi:uncharacterized LabA/DUF88 family protein
MPSVVDSGSRVFLAALVKGISAELVNATDQFVPLTSQHDRPAPHNS